MREERSGIDHGDTCATGASACGGEHTEKSRRRECAREGAKDAKKMKTVGQGWRRARVLVENVVVYGALVAFLWWFWNRVFEMGMAAL